jgi:triacylglycerol lipase
MATMSLAVHADDETRTPAEALAKSPPRNVVLLHGLVRSPRSMQKLANTLARAGHRTCNVAYPSREHSIEVLTAAHVLPAITACFGTEAGPIDFVTHSLGGIIVRQLAATDDSLVIGRVVMLAPPNRGSEIADKLGQWRLYKFLNGPAGNQLGTAPTQLPRALGPAEFELGVIAGNRSINWILSLLIPGEDDGKVSVENAKLAGMRDFLVVPSSHPFIMRNRIVQVQVAHFLAYGSFSRG